MSRKSKKSKRNVSHTQKLQSQTELSSSDQQKLSTKFQNIFDKQVLSEYENDNYRECIKQCDRILQTYPKNGETLAMKGLCLHCQGSMKDDDKDKENQSKRDPLNEEAAAKLRQKGQQLIDNGLRFNIKSSICWRVKGLAHKSDKDFDSAIICYKKASKFDKQNQRILTDLASLQIELKRFKEFAETRNELWLLNQDKLNCIALCIALYLNKEYTLCLKHIEDNAATLVLDNVELNEIYLLQVYVLRKQNKLEECQQFLNDKLSKNQILDQLKALQIKFEIERELNKFDDSIKTMQCLIDKNPENLNYHKQYLSLLSKEQQLAAYKAFETKYPKCNLIKRILLDYCDDLNEFRVLLNDYLIHKFNKSVMSLYADLRDIYAKNKEKGMIIDELVEEYRTNKNNKIGPMCLLYVNYFYCSRLVDLYRFDSALSIIDKCIAMVPTCIEFYVLKGKLFKYVGNRLLAFKYLNYARCLDTADRYLNTKCVRYALRALKIDESEEIVTLFLKKTEGTASLHKLQVIWYQLHKAEAHLSLKEYGPCVKQYQNVFHHFETFWKNQTDFHRYSYRKCAIYSYLQLLKWENTLREHPFFIRAAHNAMSVWFTIYKLQSEKNYSKLEFGSSPYNEMDKKKHRQSDERGWKLIHCQYPLDKVKQWLDYLLPLNLDDIEIDIAHVKYLMYTKQYNQMMELILAIKRKGKSNEHQYVYSIYVFVLEELKQQKELNQLQKEYDIKFLKLYFEQNANDLDKIWCVLQCCLEIPEINIDGYSNTDILNKLMSIECTPTQCLTIRNQLTNYNECDLLKIFETFVEAKYPLQLKME
eukprot:45260_1